MTDLHEATAVDGSPLSPKALQRRQRIVESAIELGTEGGYESVHMRLVAERAGVALATVYRYFESKDHLLSAAVSEWTAQLQSQLARRPARGDTPVERLVDVLRRASRGLERRPQFASALIRALQSPDHGAAVASTDVRLQIRDMTLPILAGLPQNDAEGIVAVINHVWNSTIIGWANGHTPISAIGDELENAARLLLAGRTF